MTRDDLSKLWGDTDSQPPSRDSLADLYPTPEAQMSGDQGSATLNTSQGDPRQPLAEEGPYGEVPDVDIPWLRQVARHQGQRPRRGKNTLPPLHEYHSSGLMGTADHWERDPDALGYDTYYRRGGFLGLLGPEIRDVSCVRGHVPGWWEEEVLKKGTKDYGVRFVDQPREWATMSNQQREAYAEWLKKAMGAFQAAGRRWPGAANLRPWERHERSILWRILAPESP